MPALLLPSLPLWLEVASAFGLAALNNFVLACCTWHALSKANLPSRRSQPKRPSFAACLGVASLCVLILAMPYTPWNTFTYVMSSSALALQHFLAVWKALDVLAGTASQAVTSHGFRPFAAHLVAAVEYRTDRGGRAILPAPSGQLAQTATSLAAVVLLLSVLGSLRSLLGSLQSAAVGAGGYWAFGLAACTLYLEVWTIYLFLRLFIGLFENALAMLGYVPTRTFDSPLTRSTSPSDFWGRRWNLLIHGLFARTVFRPLTGQRKWPAWAAGGVSFAISGAFHEYAFNLNQPEVSSSFGRCFLFFLSQAPVVTLEKWLGRRYAAPWPFSKHDVACTAVWTAALVPLAPLFIHPLKASGAFEQIYMLTPRLDFSAVG